MATGPAFGIKGRVVNILGISAYYHDSAACLIRDGLIVAAAQEERFTRKRHEAAFPAQARPIVCKRGALRRFTSTWSSL